MNIAPNAVVTASTCNTGACSVLNNQNYGTCGTQLMWISTLSPPDPTPGVNWIEWNWPNPESFDEMVIHHAQTNTRFLSGATMQYWDGTTWVNHHTFSNLPMQCINSITFPRLTTNRMRITSFQTSGTQLSNPNFREIEIFSAPTSANDAGVSMLVAPNAFCPGVEDIVVRVQNFGINVINFVTLNWRVNGVMQTPVAVTGPIDTVGGSNPFFQDVNLGPWTFAANTAYTIEAWTSLPNAQVDTNTFNDSLTRTISAAISGTFTINSALPTAGTNFTSFIDFADFVNINGICGPVIANVAPNSGPYVERVEFDEVVGTSPVNTITINGNGNTLSFAGNATDRTTLTLDGTDYLTVDSLNIIATGTAYGWCLFMTREADHNTFKNCTFETSTSSTSTFFSNVVMSGSPTSATLAGNAGNYNTFENNTHIGGYYGFTMNGASAASKSVGNKIINSVFEDFYFYGLYIRSQDSLIVDGNDLSRATRTTLSTFYGIFLTTGIEDARIVNNRIHDNSTQNTAATNAAYPIYLSSATGSAGKPNVMANNLIYNINNNGTIYTMYFIGALNDFWKIYHNTVVIDEPTSTSTGLIRNVFVSGAQNNMEIKNNIFYLDRGAGGTQHQMYFTSAAHNVDVNNNNYFSPNSAVTFGYSGSNISTFAAWQTAGFDVNGIEFNPDFVGTGPAPLRPRAAAIKFLGTNVLADVPTDIEGFPRTPAPDPGAYQFEPPVGIDMGIVRFIDPVSACPGTADVTVEVGNFASDTAHTIYMSWSINSVSQPPIVVTDSFYPGNLIPITLGSFTIAAGVSYDIQVNIDSVNPGPDIDLSNNSAEILGYRAGLAGTFSINQFITPSATNFTSFTDFADAVNNYGICGPVVVNVVAGTGPYLERIVFENIQGSSATNTITINGNGNTLAYSATSTSDLATLTFNGTDYVTIDSLNIAASGASFGWTLHLVSGADHNTFSRVNFQAATTGTSSNLANVCASGSPTTALGLGNTTNYTTFENCKFIGGYYGLSLNGTSTTARNVGNSVINCVFEDQNWYATYIRAQDSLNFSGNEMSRANRTEAASYYGIFFSTGIGRSIVKNNIIRDVHNALPATNTSACYPVYLSSATGVAGSPSIFANNLIYNINNGGIFYGLYLLGALNDHWKFYHNTVVMDQPNATTASATRPVFFSGAQNNFEMKNNIFYLNRPSATNFMVYMTSAANNVDFDNNVYFTPHPTNVTFGFSGANLNTFADWQGAGYDANGIETDPSFAVPGSDYHPTVGSVKAIGANVLSDVPLDLNGDPRTTSPDPGVYQFDPAPCSGAYNFVIDTLFPGGVEISWQSFGNLTEWQVEWDTCGFIPGSGLGNLDSVVTSNSNHAITMPMGQCFCVYVREKCPSGGYGVWTGPIEVCIPIEYDAQLLSLASPEYFDCGDSLMEVKVEIRNNGFFPITSLPITVEITGDINQTFTTTYTGNLLETEVDTVTMGTINSYWGGYINVVASVSLPNDQFTGNDTLSVDSLAILPFQPNVIANEYCPSDDSVTLSLLPFPNIMFNWFDAPVGGNMVHIGDEFTVSTTAPPTFYVAFNDLMDSLESTATGNVSTSNGGSMFDLVIFNTLSVTGFSLVGASSGFTDVQVYYKLGSLQGHETNPASWILHETVPNVNLQGTANFVRFNLTNPIPMSAGQTYGVYIQPVTGNLSYASGNPLGSSLGSNADLEILTGITKAGSWTSTLSPRSWKGRVHYGSESCSDIRTPVTAVPKADSVVADFTWTTISHTVSFQSTSVNADSVVWDFAGLGTATGDSVTFQFPQTDSFEVCLIAYGSCGNDTICQMVWAENISVERFGELLDLKLFPNPNNGTFTVSFLQHLKGDLQVEIIDLSGRVLLNQLYTNHQGAFNNTYDLGHLASGMYQIRLRTPDGLATRSFVVSK